MKRKTVTAILALFIVVAAGAVFVRAKNSETNTNGQTIEIITDCELARMELATGVKSEYINPQDANRPTAECKPVRLYR